MVDLTKYLGSLSENDGVLYECRRDLQQFISFQDGEEFIIDQNPEPKSEHSLFSGLIYLQVALLNNRGVILKKLGRDKEADACFEIAEQQRKYDISLQEELSKIHVTQFSYRYWHLTRP